MPKTAHLPLPALRTKKCLKCRNPFDTARPRENYICPTCAESNRTCEGFFAEYSGSEQASALLDR